MAEKINESLDFQGAARILNLAAASSGNEPVRKTEFDSGIAALKSALAGFDFIDLIARAVDTANVNTASPGATHDGVTLSNGDIILLTGQSTASQNGLWTYNGATSALTRPTVQGNQIAYQAGSVVVVGPDGTAKANTLWLQTTDNPVLGTTALTFTQFATTLSAGTGISITGSVIALVTPVSVANGGTNASTAAGARSSLGAAGRYETDFGDGVASSFTITHNLGNEYVVADVYNKSTLQKEDCLVTLVSNNSLSLSAEAWTTTPPTSNQYHVVVVG